MATYNGYNDYLLAAGIAHANPAAGAAFDKQEKNFDVAKASTYYTNTPMRASSTFVSNIRYLPTSNTVFVRLGNSTYWYPMSPRQLSMWLTSNSLGQYYNRYMKLK